MKIVIRGPNASPRSIQIHLLFYFAVLCLLASLAGAPGQLYLGRLYYLKDIGVIVSFLILSAMAHRRNDKAAMLVTAAAFVLILYFATGLRYDDTPSTSLNIVWIMKWALAVHLGILVRVERLGRAVAVSVGALLAVICIDALIGFWEIRHQAYYFDLSAMTETAVGTAVFRQEHVEDMIRILALHRNGGDFGNTMAVGMILVAFILLTGRGKARFVLIPLFLLCSYDLFFSTVRSFLVGGMAAVMAVVGTVLFQPLVRRRLPYLTFALILVCLFFSYFNIIPLVEFVSSHILNNVAIGDVTSSYMRLDAWDDLFSQIRAVPIVAFIGGPLAAGLKFNAPPSEICDNIYLWNFYHLGIFGFLGFIALVPLPLSARADQRARVLYFAAATQVLVTGIFTDSLFQFSSLMMFFPLGLILAELRTIRTPVFVFAPVQSIPDKRQEQPASAAGPRGIDTKGIT